MKKKSFFGFAFIFVVVLAFSSIYNSNKPPEEPVHKGNLTLDSIKNDYTQLYTVDSIPSNLDTVDFKTNITFNLEKRRHILSLPHAGTITSIVISDSSFYVVKGKTDPHIYSEGNFYINEPVLLDISTLPKGKYHVHVLGCSIGGVFALVIN